MKRKYGILFVAVVFFVLLVRIEFLFSIDITVIDKRNGDRLMPPGSKVVVDIKSAIRKAEAKAKKCLPKIYSNSISASLAEEKININILNRVVSNDGSEGCAGYRSEKKLNKHNKLVESHVISISHSFFWDKGACGCTHTVMLHELMHLACVFGGTPSDEAIVYSCMKKCFEKEGCFVPPDDPEILKEGICPEKCK